MSKDEAKNMRAFFSKGIQSEGLLLVEDGEQLHVYIGHKDDDPHENKFAFSMHIDYTCALILALNQIKKRQDEK